MYFRRVALIIFMFGFATNLSATEKTAPRAFSFVVIGHVRGNDDGVMQPLLGPLLAKVRALKPDMIFLTGDMIYGGLGKSRRADIISQDWERLDAALAKVGVPVYRVAGNHDINDPITRDIYFARYGKLPQAFTYRGSRFLLLNSSFVPEGNETPQTIGGQQAYLRGKQLDPKQINFIRKEMAADNQYDNVFLFMHHLLWDNNERALWWREVHPLIARRNVRAVFAGDVGPRKFSHMKRDGINYIQSSIAEIPMEYLRRYSLQRLTAQQFDNYLYVTVNGPQLALEVKTIGEISSGQFTPESWREMHRPYPPEAKTFQARMGDYILDIIGNSGSPRRQLFAFVSTIMISFVGGVAVTLLCCRRKAA
jgi:UDP-2,3-diacylglucosamine pyrophosphatase LpxH